MEGKGKDSCSGIISGGLGRGLLDFEGLVLDFHFLFETGRGGFGGDGELGCCLGGVEEM